MDKTFTLSSISCNTNRLIDNLYFSALRESRYVNQNSSSFRSISELNASKNITQDLPDFNFHIAGELTKSPYEHYINAKTVYAVAKPKSYTPPNIPQNFAFAVSQILHPDEELLELIATYKFEQIQQVKKVYINHQDELTEVKVVLEMNYYDYDLMENIFNNAEFPIKDSFKQKLLYFQYIPEAPNSDQLINLYEDRLIFNRESLENFTFRTAVNSLEFEDYLTCFNPFGGSLSCQA